MASPSDKRVRILTAQIKEFVGCTTSKGDRDKVEWIDTTLMLADSLTDGDSERGYLLGIMTTCA